MTSVDKINEQINQLGAFLQETRGQIPDKDALTRQVEDRIAGKMVESFATKQELELQRRANEQRELAILQTIDQRLNELSRIGAASGGTAADVVKRHRSNLRAFLRQGAPSNPEGKLGDYMRGDEYRELVRMIEYPDMEHRALNEGTATEGGFLVPEDIQNEIIRPAVNMSPVRELARVVTTTSNSYVTHDLTSYADAEWVGEATDASADNETYGEIRIPIHHLRKKVPATEAFLEDAPEQEMAESAAITFRKAEGTAFVNGNGVTRPRGFVTAFTQANTHILTGSDAANNLVAADDFYDLLYGTSGTTGLHQDYRRNAVFVLNSNTLRKVLKLKDADDNYLWNNDAGLQHGEPATIAGKPFRILEDMDDDGSDGKYPVAVADWQMFYRVVDRSGIRVQRDPFSNYPTYIFRWVKRLGADVTLLEAGRLLVV